MHRRQPPTAEPVRVGLFQIDPPALIGGRCRSCAHAHFPLGPACPYCAAADISEALLPDRGRLWAWTAVTSAPPGSLGGAPYGFGVVELQDGPRVVSRLTESDPARLRANQEMVLVLVELSNAEDPRADTVVTYAFAPVDDDQDVGA